MPVSNHGFETWMRVIADEMPPGDADAMRAAADQLEAFRAFRQWMEAEAGSDPSLGSMTAAEWLAAFDAERSRRASPRLMVDAR